MGLFVNRINDLPSKQTIPVRVGVALFFGSIVYLVNTPPSQGGDARFKPVWNQNYIMERTRYIYEIKNKLNGKTYIGQHTLAEGDTFETDNYYGSGKLIIFAQKKYGLENFEKKIIISGSFSKEEINRFERCMIACQRICGKAEYNISDGGDGWNEGMREAHWKAVHNELHNERVSNGLKKAYAEGRRVAVFKKIASFKGKRHSEASKKKMSEKAKLRTGAKNSSFGKHWWTNGEENIKSEICPEGFWKGRTMQPTKEKLSTP